MKYIQINIIYKMIETMVNDFDEIDIGLSMFYGEDENGDRFHAIQIGLLIFTVIYYNYNI